MIDPHSSETTPGAAANDLRGSRSWWALLLVLAGLFSCLYLTREERVECELRIALLTEEEPASPAKSLLTEGPPELAIDEARAEVEEPTLSEPGEVESALLDGAYRRFEQERSQCTSAWSRGAHRDRGPPRRS